MMQIKVRGDASQTRLTATQIEGNTWAEKIEKLEDSPRPGQAG